MSKQSTLKLLDLTGLSTTFLGFVGFYLFPTSGCPLKKVYLFFGTFLLQFVLFTWCMLFCISCWVISFTLNPLMPGHMELKWLLSVCRSIVEGHRNRSCTGIEKRPLLLLKESLVDDRNYWIFLTNYSTLALLIQQFQI